MAKSRAEEMAGEYVVKIGFLPGGARSNAFLAGMRAMLEEAESLSARTLPENTIASEPILYLNDLRDLFQPAESKEGEG